MIYNRRGFLFSKASLIYKLFIIVNLQALLQTEQEIQGV